MKLHTTMAWWLGHSGSAENGNRFDSRADRDE